MTAVLLALLGIVVTGAWLAIAPERRWPPRLFALAALFGATASTGSWLSGAVETIERPWGLPFASFSLRLDPLAAFFLSLLYLLTAFAAVYGPAYVEHRSLSTKRASWMSLTGLVAAMGVVLLSANAVLFLMAWELMSLAAFFLVRTTGSEEARSAAWTFLVASHVSGAALVAFFFLVGMDAPDLGFAQLATQQLAGPTRTLGFLLALLGFGLKAGLVPAHFWLPQAHPAAPSHGSALLSGLMIKLGIYGLFRTLPWLGEPQLWWTWVLLGLGGLSAVFAIVQAHGQDDWKRALAYSSVENMGLATLGLGLSLWAAVNSQPELATLSLLAVLLHLISHALAKSSLFLLAGCLDHATGTRNPDVLGGLSRRLRSSATSAALAATAMSGLPPTLAFASEFLLVYAGVQAVMAGGTVVGAWVVGTVALTAASAAFGFAKLYAATFLGEPRSQAAGHPHGLSRLMEVPSLVLAVAAAGSGFSAPWLVPALEPILASMGPSPAAEVGAAVSALLLRVMLIGGGAALLGGLATWALFRVLARRATFARTWGCGYLQPTPRMQYTATASSQPLLRFFHPLVPGDHPPTDPALFPAPGRLGVVYRDPLAEALSAARRQALALLPLLPLGRPGKVSLYVLLVALTLVALLLAEVFLW